MVDGSFIPDARPPLKAGAHIEAAHVERATGSFATPEKHFFRFWQDLVAGTFSGSRHSSSGRSLRFLADGAELFADRGGVLLIVGCDRADEQCPQLRCAEAIAFLPRQVGLFEKRP
jgi:hypothetical protein